MCGFGLELCICSTVVIIFISFYSTQNKKMKHPFLLYHFLKCLHKSDTYNLTNKQKKSSPNKKIDIWHVIIFTTLKHKFPTLVKLWKSHKVLKICNINKDDTRGKRHISSQSRLCLWKYERNLFVSAAADKVRGKSVMDKAEYSDNDESISVAL